MLPSRGGVCRSTAGKTSLKFWHFFETRQKWHKVKGFSTTTNLIRKRQGHGGARLAKNIQERMYIDVPHPGKMLAVWGADTHACTRAKNATDMSPRSHKPHPLQQRAAHSLAQKKWKNPWDFFSHSKMVLPAVPVLHFFTKQIAQFVTMFFSHFSHFSFHFRTIFHTVFLTECFPRHCYTFF